MASKVNTKFVVLLSVGLLGVFALVAGLAMWTMGRGGERYIVQGDKAMAAGDIEAASKFYEKGVGRDRTRTDWLIKWRDALVQTTPDNEAAYAKAYDQFYVGILDQLAVLNPADPVHARNYIAELDHRFRRTAVNSEGLRMLLEKIRERTAGLDPNSPETKKILRYRGMTQLDLMQLGTVEQSDQLQALDDLTAAVEADPTDWEAQLSIVEWHRVRSDALRRERKISEADAAWAAAKEAMAKFREDHPDVPDGLLYALNMKQAETLRELPTAEERIAAMESLKGEGLAVLDTLLAMDPKQLSRETMYRTRDAILRMFGEDAKSGVLALMEKKLATNPTDAEMLVLSGIMLQETGEHAKAIERFEEVLKLNRPPVSLAGLLMPFYQRNAAARQVDCALAIAQTAKTPEEREQAIARAVTFRDRLKDKYINAQSMAELHLRDARIALAQRRYDSAVAILSELRLQGLSDDPDVLGMLAGALEAQGVFGEAGLLYDRLIELGHATSGVLFSRGMIHYRLGENDRAKACFTDAMARDPRNTALKEQIAQVMSTIDPTTAPAADPVVRAILDAQQALAQDNLEGARSILNKALETSPADNRLVRSAVQMAMLFNDKPGAMAIVDRALGISPDDAALRDIKRRLEIENPKEASLAMIAESDASPVEKALARFQVHAKYGTEEEALAAMRDAEAADPNNAAVIELGFNIALEKGDFQTAEAYAKRAAAANLDQLNGLLYEGRIQLYKGDHRAAVVSFLKATEKIGTNPMSWRLLGLAYRQGGNVTDAIKAFDRAYRGQPDDARIAMDYAQALISAGRGKEALDIVNPVSGALRFNRNNEELVELWLTLEASFGDRQKAIERRELLERTSPDNMRNRLALANLLIDAKRWEDAGRVIEAIKAAPGDYALAAAGLRARWFALQGDVAAGAQVLRDYIDSRPEGKVTVQDYLFYGGYLIMFGQTQEGLEVYRKARPLQTPKVFEVERVLGDYLFGVGRDLYLQAGATRARGMDDQADAMMQEARAAYEEAKNCYITIVEGGGDGPAETPAASYAVTKRLVETLLRLDDIEGARQRLAVLVPDERDEKNPMRDDLQVLLLRASVAEKSKDVSTARRLADRACELHPTEPSAFLYRAKLNGAVESLIPDAIADLDQVLKLQPGRVEAWQARFDLYVRRGQVEDAFRDLRSGVERNPDSVELRQYFIYQLLKLKRRDEAIVETVRAANQFPKDMNWQRFAADLCANERRWNEAIVFYRRLKEDGTTGTTLQNTSDVLSVLMLTTSPPPSKAEVAKLLQELKSDAGYVENDLVLSMLEARAKFFLGEREEGLKLAATALDLTRGSTLECSFWLDQMRFLFNGKDADVFSFVEAYANNRGQLPSIVRIKYIAFLAAERRQPEQKLLDLLLDLDPLIKGDRIAQLELARLRGGLLYSMGKFQEAVDIYRQAIELRPTDLEINNNLAYTLSAHLGDHETALKYAEAAAELAPESANVLDTYGWVLVQMQRYPEAERALNRAIATAAGPEELLPAHIHMGILQSRMGQLRTARTHLDTAEEAATKVNPGLLDLYRKDLDSLREAAK